MINLYQIDSLEDGTERFCTSLQLGKGIASFIRKPYGNMEMYSNGPKGFAFYKYTGPYKIIKLNDQQD
jgi:hypothetical protein